MRVRLAFAYIASKMADLKTATANYEKFHSWLKSKYPPKSMFEKIYTEQVDKNTINVYYCFQYGSAKQITPVCTLQMYPMFDPEFDPNTFYKQ